MKIKTILILLISLNLSTTVFCQNYKKDIEVLFMEYLNSIINRDFEKSTHYISDDFYKIISREQTVQLMEKTFNNPGLEFHIKEPKIIEVKDSELIEHKFYSLLTYSNILYIRFLYTGEKEETTNEHRSRINLTKSSLEQTFCSKNVNYDDKTDFFEIYTEKQVYAISKNGETDWKFIVLDKKQKDILEKLLPKQLTEKI